jgi:hypothetical protein
MRIKPCLLSKESDSQPSPSHHQTGRTSRCLIPKQQELKRSRWSLISVVDSFSTQRRDASTEWSAVVNGRLRTNFSHSTYSLTKTLIGRKKRFKWWASGQVSASDKSINGVGTKNERSSEKKRPNVWELLSTKWTKKMKQDDNRCN